MLSSLCEQLTLPEEVVVIDASDDISKTRQILSDWQNTIDKQVAIKHELANKTGAAIQRNQGVAVATQPFIWFIDDDVVFETDCAHQMLAALEQDTKLGGVNAMIVNQRYQAPGTISRLMFTLMNGRREKSFAGKVIGPAINLLPEDGDDLPDVVPVEWLNTTCTMYRREALPSPPFDAVFTGYSLMEDVALSLRVGRNWKLANVRCARIFHDSQSGEHKSEARETARMELVNRYYVMRHILGLRGVSPLLRLIAWQLFQLFSIAARSSTRRKTIPVLLGNLEGLQSTMLNSRK
jgi:GT2 family glycosyltransferase